MPRPGPVYWKPRYPTRSMRERAWTKRAAAREQALKAREQALKRSAPPSLLARLRAKLRRNT